MVRDAILHEIVRPNLLTSVCAPDKFSTRLPTMQYIGLKLLIEETCAQNLERSRLVLG